MSAITEFDEFLLPTELECCYNEFEYYKQANEAVATLGWATSYHLQTLWQNSPKIDTIKDFSKTIQQTKITTQIEKNRLVNIQNFLKSKGIESLKLRYTPYIRQKETDKDKRPINFYTTLDWDKFYMKFPIVRSKSNDFLTNKQNIYTKNLINQMIKMLKTHRYINNTLKKISEGSYTFNFAIDIQENRSDLNKDSYIILQNNETTPQGYKLVSHCKPYEIDTLNCQHTSLDDWEFVKQIPFDFGSNLGAPFQIGTPMAVLRKGVSRAIPVTGTALMGYDISKSTIQTYNTIMQNLALYACTGKFSIFYAPTKISFKKEADSIKFRIDEMVAYVYDSFDFLDYPYLFDNNGEITALGQPVGAWDFKTKAFCIWGSIWQMIIFEYVDKKKYDEYEKYKYETIHNRDFTRNDIKYVIKNALDSFALNNNNFLQTNDKQQHYIYNQDYQDYQKYTPHGLDFKIYSTDIIATIDFSNHEFTSL